MNILKIFLIQKNPANLQDFLYNILVLIDVSKLREVIRFTST